MKSPSYITHEEVRARAHHIWQEAGRPQGQEERHWLQAERELQHERDQLPEEDPAREPNPPPKSTGTTPKTGYRRSDR